MRSAIKWIIFSLLCIGLIVVLVIFSKSQKGEMGGIDQNTFQVASELNGNIADHTIGNLDSGVILIEYADYQCPACSGFSPLILDVVKEYKDKIGFIYRNYSLDYHTNSRAAASTAQAASLQGKFWEMHSLIYKNQFEWESLNVEERTKYFLGLGKELDLDIEKLKSDITSESVSKKISFDRAMANNARINATPTIFLNGKMLDIATIKTEDDIKSYLDEAIKKIND